MNKKIELLHQSHLSHTRILRTNQQCIVTISHFVPYAMANGQELVNSMLQNPNIDVLSPQLYTSVRLLNKRLTLVTH